MASPTTIALSQIYLPTLLPPLPTLDFRTISSSSSHSALPSQTPKTSAQPHLTIIPINTTHKTQPKPKQCLPQTASASKTNVSKTKQVTSPQRKGRESLYHCGFLSLHCHKRCPSLPFPSHLVLSSTPYHSKSDTVVINVY